MEKMCAKENTAIFWANRGYPWANKPPIIEKRFLKNTNFNTKKPIFFSCGKPWIHSEGRINVSIQLQVKQVKSAETTCISIIQTP